MTSSLVLILVVVSLYLFVNAVLLVVRFNRAMPELWQCLETCGRGERARELNRRWSNLAAARYLYDGADRDDVSIDAIKTKLAQLHRSAILHFVAFLVSVTVLVSVVLLVGT